MSSLDRVAPWQVGAVSRLAGGSTHAEDESLADGGGIRPEPALRLPAGWRARLEGAPLTSHARIAVWRDGACDNRVVFGCRRSAVGRRSPLTGFCGFSADSWRARIHVTATSTPPTRGMRGA
jgi:hypothetical protein